MTGEVWIGIDFGTTNTAMAVYDRIRGGAKWMRFSVEGLAEPTASSKSGRLLPMVLLVATASYVERHFPNGRWIDWKEGVVRSSSSYSTVPNPLALKVLLGQDAIELLETTTEHSIWNGAVLSSVKRSLLAGATSVHTTPAGLDLAVELSIVDILSLWLRTIRTTATMYLQIHIQRKKKKLDIPHYNAHTGICRAVLGVPAAASVFFKQQLKVAAQQAGWEEIAFRTESTAAAMAYGLALQDRSSTILVVDVGGGTTDVTIATTNSSDSDSGNADEYRVVRTAGDASLGGDDMDTAILKYCGFGEEKNPQLLKRCRRAKIALCNKVEPSTDIFWQGEKKSLTLSELDTAISPILERIRCLVSSVVTCPIDEIIFIGGASRVPGVARVVNEVVNATKVCDSLSPDSAVAQGCGIAAALFMVPRYELRNALMLDTNPHSIGVRTSSNDFVEIIKAGATLPAKGSAMFHLEDARQPGVTIDAVEVVGETVDGDAQYSSLGQFSFLLHRAVLEQRSVEIRMMLKESGEFLVAVFDENDPEHTSRRAGSIGYTATEPTSKEQFSLLVGCAVVFFLYVAVKLAFPEEGLGVEL